MPSTSNLLEEPIPIIVLAGPTAVGKTELAIQIANEFNAEIIGVDSMQIYKYMDIGTAKPSLDERGRAPHHLIDFVDPAAEYNVSRFIKDAEATIKEVRAKGKNVLMAGGTGLYFKSFFEGMFTMPEVDKTIRLDLVTRLEQEGNNVLHKELTICDPESANRIHKNDTSRLLRALEIYIGTGISWTDFLKQQNEQKAKGNAGKYNSIKFCLNLDRQLLYDRINQRVDVMVEQGFLAEVEGLLKMGYDATLKSMQSLGYRHMLHYIQGECSWKECLESLRQDTRRYAKRQMTWFRKDSEIMWVSPSSHNKISADIKKHLNT